MQLLHLLIRCFIGFLFVFTACRQGKQNDVLQLTAHLGGINYQDSTQPVYIATTLYNPTNDTVEFVTMTCSYQDMFLTDTAVFALQSRYDCNGNFPVTLSIPPKAKLDRYLMVRPVNRNIDVINSRLRIGMYLVIYEPQNSSRSITDQYEQRKKSQVIWSNQLELKRLYGEVYE